MSFNLTNAISVLALLTGAGIALVFGGAMLKLTEQAKRDNTRVRYLVKFPAGLEHQAVLDFMRSLGGVRRRGLISLPTLVFEVYADATGVRHYLSVTRHELKFVHQQLDAHLPGVALTRDDSSFEGFTDVAELAMSHHDHPLGIKNPDGMTRSILANFHPLRPDQAVLMQWVVAPGLPTKPTDEKHSQEKHKENVFAAVCRIATKSDQQHDAPRLIGHVYSALNSARTHGTSFYRRRVDASKSLVQAHTPFIFPIHLNASELASLVGFPVGSDHIRGVGVARSRHLPPDTAIPSEGIVLGRASFPGMERPLAIAATERMKHMHVVGATGTGKSAFLAGLIAQEMRQGFGVAAIDPKGDLTARVLASVPPERVKDVILLDPTDERRPVGFNVLGGGNPELVTDQVLGIFHNLYSDSWGPRTSFVLRGAFFTLAIKGLTLAEVAPLLMDEHFRTQTIRGLKNDWLKGFWRAYNAMSPGEQSQAIGPVLNKIEPAMMRRSIRATLGQATSGFDMTTVLREKKILLLDLDKGKIGPETSALIGALAFSKLWQAAQSGANNDPFFCYIDEFQNYVRLPTSIDEVLAEARSKNFGLTLAHQYTGQLSPSLREGMANARNKVVFQLGPDDARVMAKELAPLNDRELQNLERYTVAMRLETPQGTAQTVTAQTLPPRRSTGQQGVARASSRDTYGRPIGEVEAELYERTRAAYEPKQRPSIGREKPDVA